MKILYRILMTILLIVIVHYTLDMFIYHPPHKDIRVPKYTNNFKNDVIIENAQELLRDGFIKTISIDFPMTEESCVYFDYDTNMYTVKGLADVTNKLGHTCYNKTYIAVMTYDSEKKEFTPLLIKIDM